MKLVICAGPATTGKTAVLRHVIRKLQDAGQRVAFLKIDVQYAEEDEQFAREFNIPTRKVYSGELCPDHFFQPRMCMLQWRHSGLVNFMNRIPGGLPVRLEGLWIG